ncbi:site-specific integrase [Ewingella americana]|uniref:hypothetical protein n=1 Tax=Ewingella americana TaxID=41202 RepID=UPI001E49D6BC|nr:hypothetical protein [Ewingella americana]
MPAWVLLSMELALITGQCRDDIRLLKKTDIVENQLRVIQGKTGERLAISLTLRLADYEMTLGDVI